MSIAVLGFILGFIVGLVGVADVFFGYRRIREKLDPSTEHMLLTEALQDAVAIAMPLALIAVVSLFSLLVL